MTPADRRAYLKYQQAADKLDAIGRGFADSATEVESDPELLTFAQPAANHLFRMYDEAAGFYAMAAEQAREVAAGFLDQADDAA